MILRGASARSMSMYPPPQRRMTMFSGLPGTMALESSSATTASMSQPGPSPIPHSSSAVLVPGL